MVLSNEASLRFLDYAIDDFSEICCVKTSDLAQDMCASVKAQVRNVGIANTESMKTFNRILCLEISDKGKENVLAAIEKLQDREDVIYVGPDCVISALSDEPNDSYINEQWAIDNINLRSAWGITTGASTVRVGVVWFINGAVRCFVKYSYPKLRRSCCLFSRK